MKQASLTDEIFETAGTDKGSQKGGQTGYPEHETTGTAAADPTPAAWPVNGLSNDEDADAVRDALLDADPGTALTVRGERVVVVEVMKSALGKALGSPPSVKVAGKDDRLVVGSKAEGVAWADDAEELSEGSYDPDEDERVVGWDRVVVGEQADIARLPETAGVAVSDRGTCPECGTEGTPTFCGDNVDATGGIHPRVSSIPETVAELRVCGGTDGCETAWVVRRDAQDLPSEGAIPDARHGRNVGGLYVRTDKCRFWGVSESDEYGGIYSGAELADNLQTFAEADHWTVTVKHDGDRVVRRDRDSKAIIKFHRVSPETVAERGEVEERTVELPEADAALPFDAGANTGTGGVRPAGD